VNDTKYSIKKSQDRRVGDFNIVLDDAQALLRHAAGEAGEGYTAARERLQQSVKAARHGVETMEAAVLDSARLASRSADSYVRSHPWEAIGIGAGVCLLLGLIIARR